MFERRARVRLGSARDAFSGLAVSDRGGSRASLGPPPVQQLSDRPSRPARCALFGLLILSFAPALLVLFLFGGIADFYVPGIGDIFISRFISLIAFSFRCSLSESIGSSTGLLVGAY